MRTHIPNVLTLLNLFCGAIAVLFAVQSHFVGAGLFVFIGICFDFLDGFVARKLGVQSELGLQLDSLADMVTSGLVPGIVMFKLLSNAVNHSGVEPHAQWSTSIEIPGLEPSYLPLLGLLITLASAYRLAKFNIDEDQQSYFKGLPTPANTLLVLSLPLIVQYQSHHVMGAWILNPWFLVAFTLVSCYLLNSNIKLFALKFKSWGIKPNAIRYSFLVLSVLFLIVFQFVAIPLIILVYIGLSLVEGYVRG